MGLFGYIFPSSAGADHLPAGLVDETGMVAGPDASAEFLAAIEAAAADAGTVDFRTFASSAEARAALRAGEIHGILIVPTEFDETAGTGGDVANVRIVYDESNPAMGRLSAGALRALVDTVSNEKARENVRSVARYGSTSAQDAFLSPYGSVSEGATGKSMTYFTFLAPGLVAMTLTMSFLSGLPSALGTERRDGTLDAILVAPVPRWAILVGKGLAAAVRSAIIAVIVLSGAVFIFGATFYGGFGVVLIVALATVFGFLGLGVLVSVVADLEESLRTVLSVVQFPILALSGVFFPIQQLPWWLQIVSNVLPTTYAVSALRQSMIAGAGLTELGATIGLLLSIGVVCTLLSIFLFRRSVAQ